MSMLQDALSTTFVTLVKLYLLVVILRFLLQSLRADLRNPLVQMLVALTDPPLRLLYKFMPQWVGMQLTASVLMVLLGLSKLILPGLLHGYSLQWSGVLILSIADILTTMVWVFLIAVLIRVVLSWVAPHSRHPAVYLVVYLSEPVLAPFRRILPSLGGLDLSPVLTLLSLQLVQQWLLLPLANWGASLL